MAKKIKRWIKNNVEFVDLFEPTHKPGRDGKGGEKMIRVYLGWGGRGPRPEDGGKTRMLIFTGGIAIALLIALIVSIVDAIRNLP